MAPLNMIDSISLISLKEITLDLSVLIKQVHETIDTNSHIVKKAFTFLQTILIHVSLYIYKAMDTVLNTVANELQYVLGLMGSYGNNVSISHNPSLLCLAVPWPFSFVNIK